MTKFTNARHGDYSLSENPIFHIIITGHDEKTGIVGYHSQQEHPRAWLINLKYLSPFTREIGAIKFLIYDYEPLKTRMYDQIIAKVMQQEGLNKS